MKLQELEEVAKLSMIWQMLLIWSVSVKLKAWFTASKASLP